MIKFDPQNYPYPSKRNVVYARNGMCNAGNPHAASAGLQTLLKGGNAVDAAIAMASAMPVVEPTGNGLGADCFVILWYEGKMYGLNASGPAPKSLSVAALKDRGFEKIPSYGVEPIDVPGAVAGWMTLHERFGKLPLEEVMAPAIRYAEEGYPVTPNISRLWQEAFENYSKYRERPEFQGWFDTFAPNNTWLKPGEMFRCPDMAKTLKEIAATKGEAFSRGAIAEKIDAFFKKHNGFLIKEDLAAFKPEWVDPISVNYHGVDVWELPPNGHGITVLMALQILKDMNLAERDCADTMHKQIEAMKLAMVDTAEYVAEPSFMRVSADQLLSEDYAAKRRALINDKAIMPEPGDPGCPSTVYFCCADSEGNMVSFIQSNFRGFGSGIVVPGTGISLNDRAENFKFDENHANALAGGKRPYHTIIPGFLTQDGKPLGPFGIMGGWMQPQAHVQVVMNMIDWHLNPQQALDAPRWQWVGGKKVEVEQETPNYIIRQLQRMGHQIIVQPDPYHMGRGQVILRDENGVLCGATEKRTDGQIMSY